MLPADERESRAFLQWLLRDHFTFLGLREYRLVDEKNHQGLELIPDSGLGVLKEASEKSQFRSFAVLSQAARSLATSPMPCIELGKTNTKATVHRPVYTDYIGVKRYKEGKVVGFCRIIGLYTSLAYRAPENIPLFVARLKPCCNALFENKFSSWKRFIAYFAYFPRDDCFMHLLTSCLISQKVLWPYKNVVVFAYFITDRFGRFVSCMVFVPRENFTTSLAEKCVPLLVSILVLVKS